MLGADFGNASGGREPASVTEKKRRKTCNDKNKVNAQLPNMVHQEGENEN